MNHSGENIHTDRHLVNKVLSGHNPSFAIIIKKTEGLVAQIIFKMVNNSEDRKDIAQDTYVKAFRRLSTFKFQSKLSTWIAQVAYNTCLSYHEKKKLVLPGETFQDEQTDEDRFTKFTTSLSANESEHLIFKKQQTEILYAEVEKLPPIYKTLVTLYHNEELSYQEIMEITGLPDGTVKNYLFRARKMLKNSLLLKYKKEEL